MGTIKWPDEVTNKEYRCQNGDLIEVGKFYTNEYGDKIEVLKIFDYDYIVMWFFEDDIAYTEHYNTLKPLWQEQPDKDGWIKHTTGKQPVADDVMVEVLYTIPLANNDKGFANDFSWITEERIAYITHYRIVEDKQESEETFKEFFNKNELDISPHLYETHAVDEKINSLVSKISDYLQKKGI